MGLCLMILLNVKMLYAQSLQPSTKQSLKILENLITVTTVESKNSDLIARVMELYVENSSTPIKIMLTLNGDYVYEIKKQVFKVVDVKFVKINVIEIDYIQDLKIEKLFITIQFDSNGKLKKEINVSDSLS